MRLENSIERWGSHIRETEFLFSEFGCFVNLGRRTYP